MRSLFLWTLSLRLYSLCTIIGPIYTIESIYGIHYFETVRYINRQTRFKRSLAHGDVDKLEYTSFKAFNRSFEIVLTPGTDILADGFVARIIQPNGRFARVNVNVNDHFSGHLLDDPLVLVDGHMEDTMIALTIFDHFDIYILEPARIYRKGVHGQRDKTWVVYRYSDTYLDGIGMGMNVNTIGNGSFCGSKPDPRRTATQNFPDMIRKIIKRPRTGKRKRRDLRGENKRNTCSMLLVVTYDLFEDRCKFSTFTCIQIMISHANFADWIFSSTDFGPYTGVRVIIKEMIIYQNTTQRTRSGKAHFNEHFKRWKFSELLQSFSSSVRSISGEFCVVFLLNAHSIFGHVLGLAYIGTTCTTLNTGFATSRTEQGTIMSTFRNRLLFIHGHIFGSHHDIEKPGCYFPSNRGGNFIMWPYITEGNCPNCQKFSMCSRQSIEIYLDRSYARKCFKKYATLDKMCGNGLVDEGEECDEGFQEKNTHSCCTDKCRLMTGATCSDHNSACCHRCRISRNRTLCQGRVKGACLGDSYCNGESLECPIPPVLENDTPCRDHGLCYEGKCKSYCFNRGLHYGRDFESCMCSQNEVTGCKVCCYDNTDKEHPGQCLPRGHFNLSDGRPCYIGFCKRGICVLSSEKSFAMQDLISGFDFTKGAKFMRNNIVSTVVVLSLLVWIPACWIITEIDKKMRILYEEETSEGSSSNAIAMPGHSAFFRDNTVLQLAPSGPAVVKAAAAQSKRKGAIAGLTPHQVRTLGSSVDYRRRRADLNRNSRKGKKHPSPRLRQFKLSLIEMKGLDSDSHNSTGTDTETHGVEEKLDTPLNVFDTTSYAVTNLDMDPHDLVKKTPGDEKDDLNGLDTDSYDVLKLDMDAHGLVEKLPDDENVDASDIIVPSTKGEGQSYTSQQEADPIDPGAIGLETALRIPKSRSLEGIRTSAERRKMSYRADPEAGCTVTGDGRKSRCAVS